SGPTADIERPAGARPFRDGLLDPGGQVLPLPWGYPEPIQNGIPNAHDRPAPPTLSPRCLRRRKSVRRAPTTIPLIITTITTIIAPVTSVEPFIMLDRPGLARRA